MINLPILGLRLRGGEHGPRSSGRKWRDTRPAEQTFGSKRLNTTTSHRCVPDDRVEHSNHLFIRKLDSFTNIFQFTPRLYLRYWNKYETFEIGWRLLIHAVLHLSLSHFRPMLTHRTRVRSPVRALYTRRVHVQLRCRSWRRVYWICGRGPIGIWITSDAAWERSNRPTTVVNRQTRLENA